MLELSKKFFSIEKDCKYKTFILLGLKIKTKRKAYRKKLIVNKYINEYVAEAVYSSWKNNGSSDELMQILKFLDTCNQFYGLDILLVYASCLIERNCIEEAERVLSKYILFEGNVDEIACYLPVAKLAVGMGIHSDLVDYAAKLFDKFESLHKEEAFINYVKNKSIAVVGNGPQEMGKGKGAEIDSHDVVIRFNKFEVNNYAEDYGVKTTVWCRNIGTVLENQKPACEPEFVIFKGDIWHMRFLIKEFYENINLDKQFDYIGFEQYQIVKTYFSNQNDPTMGFIIALWLYDKFKNFNNIDFYGFSFLEDRYDGCLHYFDDQSNMLNLIQKAHHHKEESAILKQLVQNSTY